MKKIFTFSILLSFVATGFVSAQCTSPMSTYDLVVNSTVVIPPGGPSFTSAIVCNGGNLYDSANCCTRMAHVNTGGIYQAGPAAYGMVYLKTGATFDAHGNTNFFNIYYEAGAIILNYAGAMTLCTAVIFDTTACLTAGIPQQQVATTVIYTDPMNEMLTIESASVSPGTILTVFDMAGKKVLEYTLSQSAKNQVAISMLPSGLYTYSITATGNPLISGKFGIAR
jgi:hypothetical protein